MQTVLKFIFAVVLIVASIIFYRWFVVLQRSQLAVSIAEDAITTLNFNSAIKTVERIREEIDSPLNNLTLSIIPSFDRVKFMLRLIHAKLLFAKGLSTNDENSLKLALLLLKDIPNKNWPEVKRAQNIRGDLQLVLNNFKDYVVISNFSSECPKYLIKLRKFSDWTEGLLKEFLDLYTKTAEIQSKISVFENFKTETLSNQMEKLAIKINALANALQLMKQELKLNMKKLEASQDKAIKKVLSQIKETFGW